MIRSISRIRTTATYTTARRYVHVPVVFDWEDPLDVASLFTNEELAIQETARSYCQDRLLPRILGMWSKPTPSHMVDGFPYRCL